MSQGTSLSVVILKYYEYYLPVLKYLVAHGPASGVQIRNDIADETGITKEERLLTTEKGTVIWVSRIYWAVAFLFQSEALSRPAKGIYQITDFGKKLLSDYPTGFDESVLRETEGYKRWVERTNSKRLKANDSQRSQTGEAPQESIESSISEIENRLAAELVSQIQEMDPDFLEKAVLQLLRSMGYGFDATSLEHTGKSGDEGIDGIINQDRLGLQQIYIQAKRYKTGNNVGREAIQTFMGALQGQGAWGGVFITTSTFTQGARDYVNKQMTTKIVLIDGVELGRLLVQNEIGVVVKQNYKIMEMDENFFGNG